MFDVVIAGGYDPARAVRRIIAGTLAVAGAALTLSGCGSTAPASSDTGPGSTAPTPTQAAVRRADCSASAILAALPGGATMEKFDCAELEGTEWAAARVAPGPTAFFLQWDGTAWQAEDSGSVCGTASAGLPISLLSYCTTPPAPAPTRTRTPSPRPTSSNTDPCTSRAILAALPVGATMQKYSCAQVGGTRWAAARVDPGDTVFFLQWNGSRWVAESSDSVCGAASAGLPPTLLSYCR